MQEAVRIAGTTRFRYADRHRRPRDGHLERRFAAGRVKNADVTTDAGTTVGAGNALTTLTFTVTGATATVTNPTPGASVDINVINGRAWITVTFQRPTLFDIDPASITDLAAGVPAVGPRPRHDPGRRHTGTAAHRRRRRRLGSPTGTGSPAASPRTGAVEPHVPRRAAGRTCSRSPAGSPLDGRSTTADARPEPCAASASASRSADSSVCPRRLHRRSRLGHQHGSRDSRSAATGGRSLATRRSPITRDRDAGRVPHPGHRHRRVGTGGLTATLTGAALGVPRHGDAPARSRVRR